MKLTLKKWMEKVSQYMFKCERRTLLWTNPNGAGDSRTIALALSDYDFIEVVFHQPNTSGPIVPNVLRVKVGTFAYVTLFHGLATTGTNENTGSRMITANTNSVVIGNYAYKNRRTGGGLTVANGYCIPYQIYGIKSGGGST